ncbi:hypothetical protein JQS43_06695 [Natronosporangium hydrolyticum]|uniref:Uncharacterized protein n=1 Tax=Natronosporangium hydrolyticum TaxID=2811111 RepID=A0A895YDW7_9ACTN|nr:hypothetical protein [Natronosporangium hydrolyticum]QSB16004.1 hypothetical protein JQS43_06695 [Natronosporangium hydrolyticum]
MNSAPAGQHVIVPFTVESPPGSGGSPVVSKLVEVSEPAAAGSERPPSALVLQFGHCAKIEESMVVDD